MQPQNHLPTGVAFQPQVSLLVPAEVNMRSNAPSCKYASPGYATLSPPFSCYYQLQPENYTKAFTSTGRLIGVNQEVPYPFDNQLYHHVPFNRAVDWSHTEVFPCEKEIRDCTTEIVKKKSAGNEKKVTGEGAPVEPAEYFTAENDEGYNQWVSRKQQENTAEDRKKKSAVPEDIKNLPGHYGPSLLETTNETYGQYVDLLPEFPAVYPQREKIAPAPLKVLVSFRPTNISDHHPIPDHSFAVDPRELVNRDFCYSRGINGSIFYPEVPGRQQKTAYTFSNTHNGLGPSAGERKPGSTFPMYSVTGLELNRPLPQRVSVVAGVGGKEKFRLRVPPHSVPYVYKRYMSYSAPPAMDKGMEANPAVVQRKQICVPCDSKACSTSRTSACCLDFINPQILPVSAEVRKHPDSTNVVYTFTIYLFQYGIFL
ncbi:hypothetical protein Btru_006007 [Bulinus truncatus]|nr:hypothetical protein Btru_006007 [Bulinus truncatus]